jgi:O-acetyl-ADP-ribose deacetylase (regulator of RNase III)
MHGEAKLLASCYRESLMLASSKALATIAFPCISTGIFGYPFEEAANIAVSTAKEFCLTPTSLQQVIFCCFSANDLALYENCLARHGYA